MSKEDKNLESDFNDFADSDFSGVEMDNDLSSIDEEAVEKALRNITAQMMGNPEHSDVLMQQEEIETKQEVQEDIEPEENTEKEEAQASKEDADEEQYIKEPEENTEQEESESIKEINKEIPETDKWEELDDDNNVVKKYIVYISKDFVSYIDNMSTDERSAYINDAIQQKLDAQDEARQATERRNLFIHFVIAIIVVLLFTPIALIIANKAIMATFDNYKYSQENFEKLYKHKFEKDKVFMRSLQYNKELEKKLKK